MEEAVVCFFCSSAQAMEKGLLIAKALRVDFPWDEPREVEIKSYTCRACGQTFLRSIRRLELLLPSIPRSGASQKVLHIPIEIRIIGEP